MAGSGPSHAFLANCIVDRDGVLTRRPGLEASSLYSSVVDEDGLDAVHVTASDAVYAIGGTYNNRRVYRVTGGLYELTGVDGVGRLIGTGRPVIAETEALLAIATGTAPRKLLFDGDALSDLENAPTTCTHIIAQSSRLLMNDTVSKGLVWFSGQALGSSYDGHETWGVTTTSGFFSHEARPDPLLALAENTNEVFGFGSTSLQVWTPDSAIVYSAAATREYGLSAPYSAVKREQQFYFLDHRRRFVQSDGRGAEVLSGPIQQTLNDLETVDDVWGFWYQEGVADCIVWVFPTARRCFAYQVGWGWSEWLGNDGSNWAPVNIASASERPYGGERIVGTRDGKVARLSRGAGDDFGDPIVAESRTGFLNNGTESVKHCLSVWVTLRRGTTDGTERPVGWLSYRNGPDEPWSRVAVSCGATGDALSVVRLPGFGTYRRRQWRWEFSVSDLELVSVEEEFEVSEV